MPQLIKMAFAKKLNIPFNPIRVSVFLPKKLIKLVEGTSWDIEMMHIEPAMAVKGNRKKLPYAPLAKITTGVRMNGPVFRLNVKSTQTAVRRSNKMFWYGAILVRKIGKEAMRFPKRKKLYATGISLKYQ